MTVFDKSTEDEAAPPTEAVPHPSSPEGPWIALSRDVTGNVMGLYQEEPF